MLGLHTKKNMLAVSLLQSKIPLLRGVIKAPSPPTPCTGIWGDRSCEKPGRVSRPRATEKGDQIIVHPYHRKPLSTPLLPLQPPRTVHYTQLLPTSTSLQVFHPLLHQALIPLCSTNSYPMLKSLLPATRGTGSELQSVSSCFIWGTAGAGVPSTLVPLLLLTVHLPCSRVHTKCFPRVRVHPQNSPTDEET